MNRFARSSILAISILILAIIVAGCSSGFVPAGRKDIPAAAPFTPASGGPTNGLVQSNTEGAGNYRYGMDGSSDAPLVFNMAMNTHSVDLDQYDLGELAVLRDDAGNTYCPISGDSAPGGHHLGLRGLFPFLIPGVKGKLSIWRWGFESAY